MIENVSELSGVLSFRLTVDTSIANAIRRCILADIETLVLKDIMFTKNTSACTNEVLKERFACVPIHSRDVKWIGKTVTLEKNNNTAEPIYATSNDFQMDGKPVVLFTPFKIDDEEYPLELVRLRQSIGLKPGEEVSMSCVIGTGKPRESGQYSVASKCSYGMTQDHEVADAAFSSSTESRENFNRLDAYRYYVPNSHEFVVQSTGAYTNKELVQKACEILIHGLHVLTAIAKPSTIENGYDVCLVGEDYTLGKAMEYALLRQEGIAYAAFFKPHPHDNDGILRVSTLDDVSLRIVRAKVHLMHVFTKLAEEFGGVFPKTAIEKMEAFQSMDVAAKRAYLQQEFEVDISKIPDDELDEMATAMLHGKVKKARIASMEKEAEEAKVEAEEKPKQEAEEKPKQEAEEKPKQEAEEKPKQEAEEKPKQEAEEKPKQEEKKRKTKSKNT
jgi:DNA-directed RNA polymerase subunit L